MIRFSEILEKSDLLRKSPESGDYNTTRKNNKASFIKTVYTFDKKCYEEYKLTEDILMEHAAYSMALEIYKKIPKNSVVNIVAGPGNNGADGITLARILLNEIEVSLFLPLGIKSEMGKIQLDPIILIFGGCYIFTPFCHWTPFGTENIFYRKPLLFLDSVNLNCSEYQFL